MKKYDIYKIPKRRGIVEVDEKYDILKKYCISPIVEINKEIEQEQRPKKYKLLVLDLDGTLINDKKQITPQTRAALQQIQAAGVLIVLASGRPTYGIMPLAESLGLDKSGGFVLSYNGGVVLDCHTRRLLFTQNLDNNILPEIFHMLRERGHAVLSYRNEEIMATEANDEYVQEECRINQMRVVEVGENLLQELPVEVTKLLATGCPDVLEQTEQELSAELKDKGVWVYRSAPFFLEIVPAGVDKAESLKRLLHVLDLDASAMVCVGDGGNDISMLRLAGVGVAMANAPKQVKGVADWVTTMDNNHDGVKEVIERFFVHSNIL